MSSVADTSISDMTHIRLIPFRTAAVFPFSFPFGHRADLRNAIELNFRSLLGGRESALAMIPQVTEQRTNLTRGAAWFASKEEINSYEEKLGRDAVFLPAPAAFASTVGGNGVIVWQEDDISCALWIKDNTPQMYRSAPLAESSSEELASWLCSYAAASGDEISNECVKIFRADELSEDEINRIASESFAASPSLARLDLSNRGASIAERYESFFNAAFRALTVLSATGIIFAILSLLILIQNKYYAPTFESAPAEVYRLAMGKTSRSPLASITKELKTLRGSGIGLTLEGALTNIAHAWEELPNETRLDAMRFGTERIELEGQAQRTNEIESLRDVLARNGFTVNIGDVQQIPSGGGTLRFSIVLTEEGHAR